MPWWTWIVVGAALLAAEVILPTDFFIVFFGVAAVIVGLLGLTGLDLPVWSQWLLFAFLSLLSLRLLRPRLRRAMHRDEIAGHTELVGEVVTVVGEIPARGNGEGRLRGTVWKVRNESAEPLRSGESCKVNSVDGLTLNVRKEV